MVPAMTGGVSIASYSGAVLVGDPVLLPERNWRRRGGGGKARGAAAGVAGGEVCQGERDGLAGARSAVDGLDQIMDL